MKPMGFVLDYLHGIGKLKVFTNGSMIPKVKTTTYVSNFNNHKMYLQIFFKTLLQRIKSFSFTIPNYLIAPTSFGYVGPIFFRVLAYMPRLI
jgi:hypothetical protein